VSKLAIAKYGGTGGGGGPVAWSDVTEKPSTFSPSSHGNSSHTSTFITASDLPATYAPETHGNSAHSSTFITASDLPTTYAPSSHDNAAHSTAYAADSDLTTHTGLTTTAHGGVLASGAFSGLSKITVSTNAPVAPSTGDLWVDLP
jgi:hypothetical protein